MRTACMRGVVAVLVLSGAGASAFAGLDQPTAFPAACVQEGAVHMSCSGALGGARSQPAGHHSFVKFGLNASALTFLLQIDGVTHACSASFGLKDVWLTAMAGTGQFHVFYNSASGQCLHVSVETDSSIRNPTAH
jgi:hypothetical protein